MRLPLAVAVLAFCGLAALAAGPAALAAGAPIPDLLERIPVDSARALAIVDRAQRDSAQAVVAPLVAAARARGDRALIARTMLLSAAVDIRIARPMSVMDTIHVAERLAEAARDTATWMLGMRAESMGQNYLGRSDIAEKLAKRWLDLAIRTDNAEYQAWAHTMFGWLAWKRGDLPAGRRECETALATFGPMHHRAGEPYTLNVLSNILAAQGEYDEARKMLHRVLDLGREYANPMVEIYAVQNLGALEGRAGDPARAIAYHRRAMELASARGDLEGRLVAMSNIGFLALQIGRVAEAEKIAREAIALSLEHQMGFETPYHEQELADALWAARRGNEAKGLWRGVMARGDSVPMDVRAQSALGLATALGADDSLDAALLALDGVLARYEKGDEDVRSQLLVEKANLLLAEGRSGEALAIALKHAPVVEKRGNLELALAAWTQVAEAARLAGNRDLAARAVAAATADWEQGRSRLSDPEYRELRGEQARRLAIESVEAALATPDSAGRSSTRLAFERLQRFKTRTLLERMRGVEAFTAAAPAHEDRGFDLAAFQRDVLRPGELLLEYSTAPDTTILFAVTRDSCRVVRLTGEDRLRTACELARGLFADGTGKTGDDEWRVAARTLGRHCLAGVADLVAASSTVIVAADGVLQGVPFAVLVPPGGEHALLEEHTIAKVPSATMLAALRARKAAEGRGLFAFAGADVDGRAKLAGADREVRMLEERFRQVTVWRPRATEGGLDGRTLAGWSALHFAGHGLVNDQAPWRSGIVLGVASDGSDSVLTAAEIARDTLGAPAVVLSACESAGGRARPGEGIAGLTSAFLTAGAPAVVATLWPVDDRTTERLMDVFYDELGRGATIAAALRAAQAVVRADPTTRHPFYWAGFVAIGEADARPALVRRSLGRAMLPALIGALVAAILLLAAQAMARRRPRSAS